MPGGTGGVTGMRKPSVLLWVLVNVFMLQLFRQTLYLLFCVFSTFPCFIHSEPLRASTELVTFLCHKDLLGTYCVLGSALDINKPSSTVSCNGSCLSGDVPGLYALLKGMNAILSFRVVLVGVNANQVAHFLSCPCDPGWSMWGGGSASLWITDLKYKA